MVSASPPMARKSLKTIAPEKKGQEVADQKNKMVAKSKEVVAQKEDTEVPSEKEGREETKTEQTKKKNEKNQEHFSRFENDPFAILCS